MRARGAEGIVRPPPPFVMSPDQITPEILAQLEAKLLALLPADGSTIGNGAAAKALGLGDAIYDLVKASLHTKHQIDKGQGRGGSIRLTGIAKDEFFDPKDVTSVAPLNLNAPGAKAPKAPKAEAPAGAEHGVRPLPVIGRS